MAKPHKNFPAAVQREALVRQDFLCASCGSLILDIGNRTRDWNEMLEGVEAHHVIPHKKGGSVRAENCVILCRSCHLNAHQGGRWSDISIYRDLWQLSMAEKIAKISKLYPFYSGGKWKPKKSES